MSGHAYTFPDRRSANRVTTTSATGVPTARTARTRATDTAGSRQTQWFVRTIMLLTTVFAFLDLYLLASSGHS
ncbi:MAG: hypothetical protein ABSB09_12000 [Acidimicrobiales bacterium]